eukprot:930040-Pyramimonas_sp.AAC.1
MAIGPHPPVESQRAPFRPRARLRRCVDFAPRCPTVPAPARLARRRPGAPVDSRPPPSSSDVLTSGLRDSLGLRPRFSS